MATIGMIAARQSLQKQDDHDHHQDGGLEQRPDHLVDRLLDEVRGVVGDAVGRAPTGSSWRARPWC